MSELGQRIDVRLVAALLVGAGALSACAPEQPVPDDPYNYNYPVPAGTPTAVEPTPRVTAFPEGALANGLIACFPSVIDQPDRARSADGWDFLTLDPGMDNDHLPDDPGPLPEQTLHKVLGAIVEIADPDGSTGSGFLIAPDIVITAAHVPDSKDAVITDHRGNTARIVDGCYISQSDETPADPYDNRADQIDIAILRLDRGIGQTTLTLAAGVQRGEWVTMVNTQRDATLQEPAIYNGLFVTDDTGPEGAKVLTGISPNGGDPENYVAGPGCSGGVVVNRNGDIVGMTTASLHDPWSRSNDLLHYIALDEGVILPESSAMPMGWYPNPATIMSIATIQAALTSENY